MEILNTLTDTTYDNEWLSMSPCSWGGNDLIVALSKCPSIKDAQPFLDELHNRNVVTLQQLLHHLEEMTDVNVETCNFSFTQLDKTLWLG